MKDRVKLEIQRYSFDKMSVIEIEIYGFTAFACGSVCNAEGRLAFDMDFVVYEDDNLAAIMESSECEKVAIAMFNVVESAARKRIDELQDAFSFPDEFIEA